MKQFLIFFGILLFAAGIAAQNTPVTWNVSGNSCSVLSKILAEAPDQFNKITIGKSQSIYASASAGWTRVALKTTVNFPGALASYIEENIFTSNKYFAFFGNSQSEAMARINLYAIEAQLKACLAGFDYKVQDQQNPFATENKLCPLILEFTGKKTGNMPAPVIELKIQKDNSVYGVYLEIKQYGEKNDQTTESDLCSFLRKIESEIPGNFKNITVLRTGKNGLLKYIQRSNLEMPGFNDPYPSIIRQESTIEYFTTVNLLKSEITARQKTEEIKNKIAGCLTNYTLQRNTTDKPGQTSSKLLIKYEFIKEGKTGTKVPQFVLQLKDFLGNGEFFLSFSVVGTGKIEPLENYEEEDWSLFFEDTKETSKNSSQPKLGKQLLELLEYAKDGFKAIKGEEIKEVYNPKKSTPSQDSLTIDDLVNTDFYLSTKGPHDNFKTAFLTEGAATSEIRYYRDNESTKYISYYDSPVSNEPQFRALFNKMKKELGSDFTWETDEEGIAKEKYWQSLNVIFYRKDSKQKQIELIYNTYNDSTDSGMPGGILIVVTAVKAKITPALSADQLKFVSQLMKLLEQAKDGFKAVKGNVNKELTEKYKILRYTYYNTSHPLEGAIENYIQDDGSSQPLSFRAYFAKDLSYNESKKLFESLSQQLKQGFSTGFIINEDYDPDIDINIRTVRVQRKNDDSHYIELTLVDGESPAGDYTEVYIIVK